MTTDVARLTEDLVIALSWAEPSRWEIGRLLVAIRQLAGEDAMYQAIPEGSGRLAKVCLAVVERWPDGPAPNLEFGHYRRVRHLDDDAAETALLEAVAEGWTPAMLGRWLAGFDPDEPNVAGMALILADGEDLILRPGDSEWCVTLEDGWAGEYAPTIGAAIRAAYRQRFGGDGEAQS